MLRLINESYESGGGRTDFYEGLNNVLLRNHEPPHNLIKESSPSFIYLGKIATFQRLNSEWDFHKSNLGEGGNCLLGRLKIWVFKWEENEVLFFKCEEMKNG